MFEIYKIIQLQHACERELNKCGILILFVNYIQLIFVTIYYVPQTIVLYKKIKVDKSLFEL